MSKIAKLGDIIRRAVIFSDLYSTRIGLTYQGDQSFKTLIGGIVSNFIRLGILIIALLLTITIFQRGNVSTGINNIFKDLTNDETKHYFAKNNVYFALKLYGPHPEKLLDPSYFNLEFLQVNRIKTADSNSFSVLSTPIEYEYCGNKFPHVQDPIYSKVGLSTYICPKNTDFYLRANFKSINYAIIQVNLVKCNGSQCKSDDEINSVLNTHYIDFEITSAYLDFNDFDNPVHTYLKDRSFTDLIPNLCSLRNYRIKINQVNANDNIFLGSQGPTTELSFYSIDLKQASVGNFEREGQKYLSMYITLDQQINQYSRTVYSFWDMLGYIGGIYGLLYSLGNFVFSFFMQKVLHFSLLSNLYHIETQT